LITQLNVNTHQIIRDNYAGVNLALSIRGEINNIGQEAGALLLNRDEADRKSHLDAIDSSRRSIEQSWNELESLPSKPKNMELLAKIRDSYTDYNRSLDRLIQMLEGGKQEEMMDYYFSEVEVKRMDLFALIREYSNRFNEEIEQTIESSNNIYRAMVIALAGFVGLIFVCAALIARGVFRSVTRSLRQIADVMVRVTDGGIDPLPRLPVTVHDEIGQIAHAFNQMAGALERRSAEAKRYEQALRDRNWHQAKVAEISALFQGEQDVRTLAETFVEAVSPIIGAGRGAFYLKTEPETGPARLIRLASYAGEGEDAGAEQFALGEGLVGQCVKENKRILLHDVPDHFLPIRSGLGSAAPVHLLLMPVSYEGKAVAVFEAASFHPFEESKLTLLEEIVKALGVAIHSALAYMQIRKLLSDSQRYAEELQAQSEELQLHQEELSALNEQLEEQYKQSDRRNKELEQTKRELEEKNREVMISSQYKTEFLANVSHELRTPLNSLLLMAQLLVENKDQNLLPKQLDYIKAICASGNDLLKLINDILDLSKIESGKMETVQDEVDLGVLGETLRRQFQPVAAQKDLDFHIEFRDDVTRHAVYTDGQKLLQILKNLLSNAFKFTERGSVTLLFRSAGEAEAEAVGYGNGDNVLAVSVSDTGVGIPEDKRRMVFEAFRQADGTTSRRYGGTGLGLSISREMASLLGGNILLESEEGRGSTFTLLIPRQEPAASLRQAYSAASAAAETEPAAGPVPAVEPAGRPERIEPLEGRKIMLVDDDMRNIFALTGVLESFGAKVVFAENGQEGIDKLEQHPDTDLILMDIMMPKMDGFEAIRTIRASDAPYRDIPIIALTAKAMKNDREKCIEAGASDYISKPVQFEQLLSLLRVWLHR